MHDTARRPSWWRPGRTALEHRPSYGRLRGGSDDDLRYDGLHLRQRDGARRADGRDGRPAVGRHLQVGSVGISDFATAERRHQRRWERANGLGGSSGGWRRAQSQRLLLGESQKRGTVQAPQRPFQPSAPPAG